MGNDRAVRRDTDLVSSAGLHPEPAAALVVPRRQPYRRRGKVRVLIHGHHDWGHNHVRTKIVAGVVSVHVVGVGQVVLAVVQVQGPNQRDSGVEGLPRGVVKVWDERRSPVERGPHSLKVLVRLLPDQVDLAAAGLSRDLEGVVAGPGGQASVVEAHHPGVGAPLHPPQTELWVCPSGEDVVGPKTVGNGRTRRGVVGLVRQGVPVQRGGLVVVDVPGEPELVPVVAEASPPSQHHGPLLRPEPLGVGAPDLVEPEGRVGPAAQGASLLASLLPVNPEKVDRRPVGLERVEGLVLHREHQSLVGHAEGDGGVGGGVDPGGRGGRLVPVLQVPHALVVVDVAGQRQVLGLEPVIELLVVWQDPLIPRVPSPAVRGTVLSVPVHIVHEDVQRKGVHPEVVHDVLDAIGVVIKPTRPPGAENLPGEHGNDAANGPVVAKRRNVVQAVSEEVPVLLVCVRLVQLPPSIGVIWVNHGRRGVIEDGPTASGEERPVAVELLVVDLDVLLLDDRAIQGLHSEAVQRLDGSGEGARVLHSRSPVDLKIAQRLDVEVGRGESLVIGVLLVRQAQEVRLDHGRLVVLLNAKLGSSQIPVYKRSRRSILESTRIRVLQADQAAGKHSEPRLAVLGIHHGGLVRNGVVGQQFGPHAVAQTGARMPASGRVQPRGRGVIGQKADR
mmetsp:Transcript_8258/g.28348  ORF Transcript_8258/g.28348 Transcript_8258/m.28348 type:complete len:672 (-) Transcript_8258:82-2097(-)